MAFVDELKIFIKAGRGGDGVVRWRHEKNREFGGPSGGNGGRGGDVYFVGVRNTHLLSSYKHKKNISADVGGDGENNGMHGANGKDLMVSLPVGSSAVNMETGEKFFLDDDGQKILVLKGGNGGRGNESYKSSTNIRPDQNTLGQAGQQAEFRVELSLIADIGLVGIPSAGKSSLLNAITATEARTADYPFTTLEPNLGEMHGYIIADIPGLIEGASEGKGLGHKFLKHVKKTKILVHLVPLDSEDVLKTYNTIRRELEEYDKEFIKKKEIILLSKTDTVSDDEVKDAKGKFKDKDVYTVSIYDDESLKVFTDEIIKILRKLSDVAGRTI